MGSFGKYLSPGYVGQKAADVAGQAGQMVNGLGQQGATQVANWANQGAQMGNQLGQMANGLGQQGYNTGNQIGSQLDPGRFPQGIDPGFFNKPQSNVDMTGINNLMGPGLTPEQQAQLSQHDMSGLLHGLPPGLPPAGQQGMPQQSYGPPPPPPTPMERARRMGPEALRALKHRRMRMANRAVKEGQPEFTDRQQRRLDYIARHGGQLGKRRRKFMRKNRRYNRHHPDMIE